MRIIVTGLLAQHPLGGLTWHYAQYAAGLTRLGHDVYYFEDTGMWPYALDGGATGTDFIVSDCGANAEYLAHAMRRFALDERWAYNCAIDGRWFGLTDADRLEIIRTADLLISVSAPMFHPDEYRHIPRRAFIDTDPVFTQIKLVRGQADFRAALDAYDVHFSFGEAMSAPIPATGHRWRPTRQPVLLSEWLPSTAGRDVFTTVMNWDSYNRVQYQREPRTGRRTSSSDASSICRRGWGPSTSRSPSEPDATCTCLSLCSRTCVSRDGTSSIRTWCVRTSTAIVTTSARRRRNGGPRRTVTSWANPAGSAIGRPAIWRPVGRSWCRTRASGR